MRIRLIGIAFSMIAVLMVSVAFAQGKAPTQDQEVAKLLEALSRQEQPQPSADSAEKDASSPARETGPTIREIYRAAYTDAERATAGMDFNASLDALGDRVESASADLGRELSAIPDAPKGETSSPNSRTEGDAPENQDTRNIPLPDEPRIIESKDGTTGSFPPSSTTAENTGERRIDRRSADREENPLDTLRTRVVQLAERVRRLESTVSTNRATTELGQ